MRLSSSSTVVLVILTILLLPGVARAQLLVIDQQSPIQPGVGAFAIGGNSEQILAQVVTTGITGPLVGINVPVFGLGDLFVEIQGVTGAEPDGSIFLSQIFPGPLSGSDTFVSLMFSTPISFSDGDVFAIVLSSTGFLAMSQAPTGDSYIGGSAFFDSRPNQVGVWVPLSIGGNPDDLAFQSVVSVRPGIGIDIKPGSDPNAVNPRSNGVIPVAVLSLMDFGATQVDFSTVGFGPNAASPVHDGHVEDVNNDGFFDMVFHFHTQDTGIACGDTEATLSGETFGGEAFTGTDSVKTAGCQ